MKVTKGYKQTDIGLIPEDWEVKKVSEFTNVTSGGTPSTAIKEFWGGKIKWMNSGELNLKRVYDVENRITQQGLKNSATKLIPTNCILIGLAGQGKTRGTVAINYVELCTNQSIAAIFPCNEIEPEYLYQNLDSRYNELRNESTGDGGRGGLNLRIIKNLLIPIPFKEEQIAIANALLETDELISSLENLIAKKQNIKSGTMQILLTGKKRLKGFKGEWKKTPLKKIGDTYGGLSGKTKKDFENGKFAYITFLNVMNNPVIDTDIFEMVNLSAGESQNKVQKGDLLFNGSSETPEEVGMCSVLLKEFPELYLNSFCFGFRLKKELKNDALFLSYYFRSKQGRKLFYSLAQGATRYNLSKSNFLQLEIHLPEPDEQKAIAVIFSDMDSEIETLQQQLSKYKLIKEGMMQNLLTGRVRLV